MARTITLREYARRRGVALNAIQQQVKAGTIRLVDGRVDPEQADDSWGLIRRARLSVQDNEAGQRSARSKVVVAVAKLRLAKERLAADQLRYVERAAAIDYAEREVELLVAALTAAPAGYAAEFAAELGVDAVTALAILDRFVTLALGELGNVRRQAVLDVERA